VLHAYQALSIDERRAEFPPTLWTNPAPGQTLEQVWFSGVHCDVGGGYADDSNGTALSDITLAWMISKATARGLVIDPGVQSKYAIPLNPEYSLDQTHESWTPLWGFPRRRPIDTSSILSNSVCVRCEYSSSYRPENLSFTSGALSSQYGVQNLVVEPPSLATGASAGKN
jgi:hypothetical protein